MTAALSAKDITGYEEDERTKGATNIIKDDEPIFNTGNTNTQ